MVINIFPEILLSCRFDHHEKNSQSESFISLLLHMWMQGLYINTHIHIHTQVASISDTNQEKSEWTLCSRPFKTSLCLSSPSTAPSVRHFDWQLRGRALTGRWEREADLCLRGNSSGPVFSCPPHTVSSCSAASSLRLLLQALVQQPIKSGNIIISWRK